MRNEYEHTKGGDLSGFVKGSDSSHFGVTEITLKLNVNDAHALANCIHYGMQTAKCVAKEQEGAMYSVEKGIREIVG